jgi:hypothetical protein
MPGAVRRRRSQRIKSKSLWRWYINTIIVFLDIVYCPVSFYLKQRFGDCILSPSSGRNLFSWNQSMELVPISGGPDWVGFCLKKETEASHRNVVSHKKNRTMDNVQKHKNCIDVTIFECKFDHLSLVVKHQFIHNCIISCAFVYCHSTSCAVMWCPTIVITCTIVMMHTACHCYFALECILTLTKWTRIQWTLRCSLT